MIITNKNNLPQALVDAVKETHPVVEKHYSVTTLLQPTREILLKRRHYDDIEQDVSDMVWLIFGSAVHKILEDADKTGKAEMKLESVIVDDYVLTGITDLYDEENMTVEDWKTASVWKIIHEEFDDWKKQGLMYAWLLRKKGFYTKKLKFNALLKDWTNKDFKLACLKNSFFPSHPIWTWEYDITEQDMIDIEKFITDKFNELIANEKLPDDQLPLCTMEERWNPGDKYAVKKIGAAKASKVCDTEQEAHQYITEKMGGGAEIEIRKGEDRKCEDYCLCKKYCSYWRKNHEK